jgi:hypothetical protein
VLLDSNRLANRRTPKIAANQNFPQHPKAKHCTSNAHRLPLNKTIATLSHAKYDKPKQVGHIIASASTARAPI